MEVGEEGEYIPIATQARKADSPVLAIIIAYTKVQPKDRAQEQCENRGGRPGLPSLK